MEFGYIKALHIIFVVTWFAGLFYIVRLFIYFVEADKEGGDVKAILQKQYKLMSKRLWYGITWPSAILTAVFASWLFSLIFLYAFIANINNIPKSTIPTAPQIQLIAFLSTTKNTIAKRKTVAISLNILSLKEEYFKLSLIN